MRDVVIIGGGLSGLAAAYTLETHGISYTLIEVKPRLGGSIATEKTDGFALDHGPMLTLDAIDAPFLEQLGLRDAVQPVREDEDGSWLVFKRGMGELIDTLARPLHAANAHGITMMRMAASTLGEIDMPRVGKRFVVCMENGMVLDARALIVAAPARYAERLFHTLNSQISYRLLDYRYDNIARVSLGYRREDLKHIPHEPPPDYPVTYIHHLQHSDAPDRIPPGHVLLQAGVRYDPAKGLSPDVVGELAALMDWPLNPVVERVSTWSESDPLMWLRDEFAQTMDVIRHLLPDGVALAGSDYIVTGDHRPTLQERIDQGISAAQRVMAWL